MELFNLTRQEIRILQLICEEKSNEEIAQLLFVSKRTVEWHKNQILTKTGTKNIIGLFKYAVKNSLYNYA
ncbi:MAG: helix-turn-helix transcriptional regulator [Bacteroidia bacterium]|nr:helix-turn-helix transcriptional regulator [Bacteroidia bacterium]